MKKTLSILSVLSVLALLLCLPAFGQTAMTTTTLSAAVSSTSTTTIRVASATGITAGSTMLYIEDGTGGASAGEALFVNSVNGTAIGVTRGYYGTYANTHISGALVFVGPPNAFNVIDPTGACTAANTPFTPYLNVKTGNQWLCSTITNSWVPGWFNTSAVPGVTAAVASVAGATNPSGPLFHVTGALAITAWGSSTSSGLSAGGGGSATNVIGAPFCIIPDGAFTTTATNNIALASTAVVNKILCYTFDQTNKKYVPSY